MLSAYLEDDAKDKAVKTVGAVIDVQALPLARGLVFIKSDGWVNIERLRLPV